MPFHYPCFMSYRGVREERAKRFYRAFHNLLEEQLDYLESDYEGKVYFDEDRIDGGDVIEEKLRDALAHSVCMVLVYTPRYFSDNRTYCAREYRTMLALEQRRCAAVPQAKGTSLIIPVVHRGNLPDELNGLHSFTFARELLSYDDLEGDNVPWDERQKIQRVFLEIAKAVHNRCELFRNAGFDPRVHCKDAQMPDHHDTIRWLTEDAKIPRQPQSFPVGGGP